MDEKYAKHLRATEAVEALWSEQESQDATYRIANASIQDSQDDCVPDRQRFATVGIVGVSGTGAVSKGVSSNEGAGGKTSS